MNPPTLRDVAKVTGFSAATISYALRDHPKIRPETRRLIQAEARRIGYRPNPLVAATMAQVRAAHPPRHGGTIAGLTWWRSAAGELNPAANRAFWRGAVERAARLGWTLEEMRCDAGRMSWARRRQILEGRGVPAVLITPLPGADDPLELDLDGFAVAAWGYTPRGRNLHRACVHHGHGMALAFARARAMGYRRIGLALSRHQTARSDHLWETSYHVQQRDLPATERLDPLIVGERPARVIADWLRVQRPDIVLTTIPLPARVPMIDLDRTLGGPPRAGLDQRHAAVGAAGIDLLIGQLHANERGEPEVAKLILIEGAWVDGPLRGPALGA